MTIDEEHFLHEYDENNPTQSCLGGFVIYARKNRIVCSQTLDDRLAMAYQHAIPQMRANLFPSITKQKWDSHHPPLHQFPDKVISFDNTYSVALTKSNQVC